MNKSKLLLVLFAGVLFGGAFAISAFTEPSAPPGSTTSYVPINVGPMEQVRNGPLCIGDGDGQIDSSLCASSLVTSGVLATENLNVRQNATLVGNIEIKRDTVIAGLLRIPELFIPEIDTTWGTYTGVNNFAQKWIGIPYGSENQAQVSLFLEDGATTNLGMGKTCTITNAACPIGTILTKFNQVDSSTFINTCREINPSDNPNKTPQGC